MSTASITEDVLAELAIPVERVKLDLKAGEAKKPDYLKINPNGKVPTIVHEGSAIWESAAITIYLGEVFGEKAGLYPAVGPKRGEAMKWIVWGNVTLAGAAIKLYEALNEGPDAVEKAKAGIIACLEILDPALKGTDFLVGHYTLADTHLQSIVHWATAMNVDVKPFHNIVAWLKRCRERPALACVAQSSGAQ
jgi:glutathione S-transferase